MENQERHNFYREVVRIGAETPADIVKQYPLGTRMSSEQVTGWLTRFNRAPQMPLRRDPPRLINSFKIGADPEFIFRSGRQRVSATVLGLKTGLAFGADQNGRLVELRPKAYRSALKVMASILQELRWLTVTQPVTQKYEWLAGAWQMGDGIGGHVHFGRKRETRPQEVDALANIMAALTHIGTFSQQEVSRRMQGDERGQIYGRLDDIRLQNHGYEYRAFPSWLDSPWTTFLTLVLAKLAVYDPDIVMNWVDGVKTVAQWKVAVRNLLALYRGRDDDAELALWTLQRNGFPQHVGQDFKERWGLAGLTAQHVDVIPPTIGASPEAVEEIWAYLAQGLPLQANKPQLNWSPSSIPEDFSLANTQDIHRFKGYGELVWDICYARRKPVQFVGADDEMSFLISRKLEAKLPKGWMQQARQLMPPASVGVTPNFNDSTILIGTGLRTPRIAPGVRRFLLSGLFPVWSVKTVAPDSLTQWQERVQNQKGEERRFDGKVLFDSQQIQGDVF